MKTKIRVGILFGGKSAEHEVSLQSAKSIINAIDKAKYEIILIGIDKNGKWHFSSDDNFLHDADSPRLITLKTKLNPLAMTPGDGRLINLEQGDYCAVDAVDVVFPVLHGTYGEDGTVQGLLKLAGVPFVGAGVLGSAVGMDKEVMKRLLRDANIPMADYVLVKRRDLKNNKLSFSETVSKLGLPLFIKPSNAGSSVGISKVKCESEFLPAIEEALQYDDKVIVEQFIKGRELECSILGNEEPIASVVGEIIVNHEFYSYEAKYLDENGASVAIPANIPKNIADELRKTAVQAYEVLCCEGLARMDFFLDENNNIFLNEINTLPGFTKISMYPKLWEATGIKYSELIDKLLMLAIERNKREQKLKTSFPMK